MDVGKTDRIKVYLSDADSFIKEAEGELNMGLQKTTATLSETRRRRCGTQLFRQQMQPYFTF